jgi:diaminohydroxyphosphoribosylaminopyrimidine deaminase/5-amino-6-(5-phosphoribosylamino)uracil reductase
MNHHTIMKDVLQLAARGRGSVYPNPMVGALVIKDGRVIGRGYHAYLRRPPRRGRRLE